MSHAAPRPLLSACLIVKNEEDMIRRCLTSLEGVADEIVVLDTGSTDDTVEIARSMGATVHLGEWHDDFGRARNEALAHCSGNWVIYIDADEELLVSDPRAFRQRLKTSTVDAYTVRIHNLQDISGVVLVTHEPVRLFHRRRFTFEGRIHEHPVPLPGVRGRAASIDQIQIKHYGYVADVIQGRDKITRNTALAKAAYDAAPDSALARLEYARILATTDRTEEAMSHLVELRTSEHALVRHTSLHIGAQVLVRTNQCEEALEWIADVESMSEPTALSIQTHAEALTKLGRMADALEVLEHISEGQARNGVHGNRYSSTPTAVLRGRLLATLGRKDEAVEVLLDVAPDATVALWPMLIELLIEREEMPRVLDAFVRAKALGDARTKAIMAELGGHDIRLGDALSEALAAERETVAYALAFAVLNSSRLPIERAVFWSGILRAAGSADRCPLLSQADDICLPAQQRIMAAALAIGAHDDDSGRRPLRRVMAMLPDTQIHESLYTVAELAPTALTDMVAGFVTSQRRATVMASALIDLGAQEQAAAVLHYGLEECTPDPAASETIHRTLEQLQFAGTG